jgi:hypothetical protein
MAQRLALNVVGPKLFTPAQLQADPCLTDAIIKLTNDAFQRPRRAEPGKWDLEEPRFETHQRFFDMIGSEGIFAALFDQDEKGSSSEKKAINVEKNANEICAKENDEEWRWTGERVVATAGAVPWVGGWTGEGRGLESGWEIRAISVDGGEKYLRKGLALGLLTFLETHLVRQARIAKANGANGKHGEILTLWIQAAECLNGMYWRKRGYREVRRSTQGKGVWGCQTSFEIVVLKKDIELDGRDGIAL